MGDDGVGVIEDKSQHTWSAMAELAEVRFGDKSRHWTNQCCP
jgi:hypothetical protein